MFENQQPIQSNINQTTGGQADNPVNNQQFPPQVSNFGANKLAEDMFADLDSAPAPAPASANQPLPVNSSQPASVILDNPLSIEQPPAKTGNTFKYLIIGLVTLIVVLIVGVFFYQRVLKPRFQGAIPQDNQEIKNNPDFSEKNTSESDIFKDESVQDEFIQNEPAQAEVPDNNELPSLLIEKKSDPALLDSDSDGLTDLQEEKLRTNKFSPDTDGDGLTDKEEIDFYNTNPNDPDTDGDTYLDGQEVKDGYNPNGPGKLEIRN